MNCGDAFLVALPWWLRVKELYDSTAANVGVVGLLKMCVCARQATRIAM